MDYYILYLKAVGILISVLTLNNNKNYCSDLQTRKISVLKKIDSGILNERYLFIKNYITVIVFSAAQGRVKNY